VRQVLPEKQAQQDLLEKQAQPALKARRAIRAIKARRAKQAQQARRAKQAQLVPRVLRLLPLTYDSLITTDVSTGNVFDVTLSDNATLDTPVNPTDGQRCFWRIRRASGEELTLSSSFVNH
jgi:hypothetical protein